MSRLYKRPVCSQVLGQRYDPSTTVASAAERRAVRGVEWV